MTACQLATALALRKRRDGKTDPEGIELVRRRYDTIRATVRLPPWGSAGIGNEPGNPWYWWRLRWSLLDGSEPTHGETSALTSPELGPAAASSESSPSGVTASRPKRAADVAQTWFAVLGGLGAIGSAVFAVVLGGTNAGTVAATVSAVAAAGLAAAGRA